jgi:hypothetical protein
MKTSIKFKILLAATCGTLFVSTLPAQTVSRAEYSALLKRVEALEANLQMTRNLQMESLAAEAVGKMPETTVAKQDRGSLIDDVVQRIQSKEEAANYPWMESQKWTTIRKGMSQERVIAILGEPTLDEPSLHKRKDRVFTWQGRRVATNKRVEGIIRFYKGEVIEIEPPAM